MRGFLQWSNGVGECEGASVGREGDTVGLAVGARDGCDGDADGYRVGLAVGDREGFGVGLAVGDVEGAKVGCEGDAVGDTLGCRVGAYVEHVPKRAAPAVDDDGAQSGLAPLHTRLPKQSWEVQHVAPVVSHGGQSGPPQSWSVSSTSMTPFRHVGIDGDADGLAVGRRDGLPVGGGGTSADTSRLHHFFMQAHSIHVPPCSSHVATNKASRWTYASLRCAQLSLRRRWWLPAPSRLLLRAPTSMKNPSMSYPLQVYTGSGSLVS